MHSPPKPTHRRWLFQLSLSSFACLTGLAQATKPAPNAPVRKELVEAIRHDATLGPPLQGHTLDIHQMWASDRWGYVCLIAVDKDGRHERASDGETFVVQQIVLEKKSESDGWVPVARIDGLSQSVRKLQCASDASGQINDAFLESVATNPSMALVKTTK